MTKETFSFPSSDGRSTIQGCFWAPDTAPKGVIQVAHGITEHMGRYEEMGMYFAEHGYVLAGHDQIGHGASISKENPLPAYFGPKGSWKYVVEDLRICAERMKERFPSVPYCMLGLSLGSFGVRCVQGLYPGLVDMGIWAGTCHMSSGEIAIASLITAIEAKRFGDTTDTPLLHKLTMGSYNKYFEPCRTTSDWLLATPEALDEYVADPLTGDGFTVSSFRELLAGMKQCCSVPFMEQMNRDTPILLLSGEKDPVGKFGKSVAQVRDQLTHSGFQNVHMELFPAMRHDIFREAGRMDVFRYIEEKLETCFPA